MALVAYDNSDSSEYEDDEIESVPVTADKKDIIQDLSPKHNTEVNDKNSTSNFDGDLFTKLPQPSNKKPTVIEEDDEFLHKKENAPNIVKPKAKITVPSLSDFKDVESVSNLKPKQMNGKKSGLLGLLPQPKNGVTMTTKSMIPHVLTQKPNIKKKDIPTPKKAKLDQKPLINDYSDESDNDEMENDFFSINKPVEVIKESPIEIEKVKSIETTVVNSALPIEPYFKDDICEEEAGASSSGYEDVGSSYGDDQGPEQTNDVVLDEEAIMKLCGSRGKRKREEIQIVDVNQKEVLAEARQLLLKGLMDDTSKRISVSKRKGHEPTSQQKRKHQITYLAYQAKANEAELQNQWANNRMSRRQTQSKYGF